jgi:hypothetical protein
MQKPILAAMTAALAIMAPFSPMDMLSPKATLSSCGGGYYNNTDNDCVESPDQNPGTHDRDNTNSHSEHRQGSGSWHGGTGKSK